MRNGAYQMVDRGTWETLAVPIKVFSNNLKKKGRGKDREGVGLTHSSEEAGNNRGAKGLALIRSGEGTHRPITELEELWKHNFTAYRKLLGKTRCVNSRT